MSFRVVSSAFAVVLVACLSGCHATNRSFRAGKSVVSLSPPPAVDRPEMPCPKDTVEVPNASGTAAKHYQDRVATKGHPCVAFLEFDDMGEPFDRDGNGHPHELDEALYLIRDSRQYAKGVSFDSDGSKHRDPSKLPIIVVFIHGWKHNASEPDLNVQGFEDTIRYLSGQAVANLREKPCASASTGLDCQYSDHPIIGVYVGWRGDLVNRYMPVAQDFSYFNRENAAERTGSDNLTHALMAISKAAGHAAENCDNAAQSSQASGGGVTSEKRCEVPSFLIFVGHSFGGLVLERSVNQAIIREFDRTSAMQGFLPIADLIVYVNSAAAATFSKPMVDIFAERHIRFGHPDAGGTDAKTAADAMPLMLSVSTRADAATNIVLPAGQNIGSIPKHLTGSFLSKDPMACYDPYGPKPQSSGDAKTPATPKVLYFKQSVFYTHSAPHIEQMHSHEMLELMQEKDGKKVPMSCPKPGDPPPLPESTDGVVRTFDMVAGRCFIVVDKPGRCNGTPYWIMRVDKSIIPDHGTIFTGRFLDFLINFFPPVQPRVPGVRVPEQDMHPRVTMEPMVQEPAAQ